MNTIEVLKEMLRVMNLVGMLGYDEDRIAALTEAIEQLEWIPVSERLPEADTYVLLHTKGGDVTAGYRDGFANFEWHEINETYFTLKPTHWMPLPKPPSLK